MIESSSHCPYYQNNVLASQKYDMTSGHMIIIESSGRPWFRGGSVTGLADTTPDEMIDEKTLPPDVANKIKVISKPTKKPPKLRAAAKIESAPANPIFLQASETTDDPFWKDIFKRMSRNIYRKGFRFFTMASRSQNKNVIKSSSSSSSRKGSVDEVSSSHEEMAVEGVVDGREEVDGEEESDEKPQITQKNTVGRFVYRSKTKEYSVMVPEDPEEAFKEVKNFMRQHAALMSEMDQRVLDRIILDYSVDPFDALPKEWSEIKGSGSRSMLIAHYVEILKATCSLTDFETKDLISTINLGVASGYLGDGSIHLKHGAIDHIEGLKKDKDTGEFYISIEEAMKFTTTKPNNTMATTIGRKPLKQPVAKRSTKTLNIYKDFIKNLDATSPPSSSSSSFPEGGGKSSAPFLTSNALLEPSPPQPILESGGTETTATTTSSPLQVQEPTTAKKRGRKKTVVFSLKTSDSNKNSSKLENASFSALVKTPAPTVIFGSALEAVEKYLAYVVAGKGKETLTNEDKDLYSCVVEDDEEDCVNDENDDEDAFWKGKKPFEISSKINQTIKLKRDECVSSRFPSQDEIVSGVKIISENLIKTSVVSVAAASAGFVFSSATVPSTSSSSLQNGSSVEESTCSSSRDLVVKTIKENIERIECARKMALKFAVNTVYNDSFGLKTVNENDVKIFCVPEGIRKLFESLIIRSDVFKKIVRNSSAGCHFELIKNGGSLTLPQMFSECEKIIFEENKKFVARVFGEEEESLFGFSSSRNDHEEDENGDDDFPHEEDFVGETEENSTSDFDEDFSSTPSKFKAIESKNNARKHKHLVNICDDILKATLNFYKKNIETSSITGNNNGNDNTSSSFYDIFNSDSKIIKKTETLTYSHVDRVFKTRRTTLDTILSAYASLPSSSDLSAWTVPESPSVLCGGSSSKPGASVKRWWRLIELLSKKTDVDGPQQRQRKSLTESPKAEKPAQTIYV